MMNKEMIITYHKKDGDLSYKDITSKSIGTNYLLLKRLLSLPECSGLIHLCIESNHDHLEYFCDYNL